MAIRTAATDLCVRVPQASALNRWVLAGIAALSGTFGGAARAEPANENVAVLDTIRASQPPHCMADGQWHDPLGASPLNLFDGDVASAWVVCPEAAATPDYAVDITFTQPVKIDRVRIRLAEPAGNHPRRLEVGLHNRSLSAAWPVWFHTLNFTGEPQLDLTLAGRMPWNPQLLNDVGFIGRRQAAGLSQYDVPVPLPVDKITVVLRAADASKGPVSLGEIELYLGDKKVAIDGLPGARVRHAEYLGQGLTRALKGRTLVGPTRTLHLQPDGSITATGAAAAPAPTDEAKGAAAAPPPEEAAPALVGRWRVVGGRLELQALAAEGDKPKHKTHAARTRDKKKAPSGPPVTADGFTVVNVRIDDAPMVRLLDGPFAGDYRAQGTAAPAKAATTVPAKPAEARPAAAKGAGDDDLPFSAGDDEDDGEIPIP